MKKSLKRNVEDVDFKKPAEASSKSEEAAEEDVGPMLPPGFVPTVAAPSSSKTKNSEKEAEYESSDSDSSDSDSSDDEDDSRMTLPISSEITLNHGTKPIPAMALDPSGARLLTGGNDYMMKFWDFPGMTQTLEPFRYLEPQEGHQIRDLRTGFAPWTQFCYHDFGDKMVKLVTNIDERWSYYERQRVTLTYLMKKPIKVIR